MASELKVDKIFNAGGDQDTGINLATNDTIKFDIATSTKATMASTGIVTIVGEGGTTTTNLQQGLCKAWVNHNQTTVHDSFNVGSVTDNSTGDYGLNFTNNMVNIHYSGGGFGVHDGGGYTAIGPQYDHDDPFTTSQATYNYQGVNQAVIDAEPSTITIVGDLA